MAVSAFGLRRAALNPAIGWIGIGVGAVLSANVFVPALLNVSFMTLPLWLILFGASQLRAPSLAAADERSGDRRLAAG